MGQTLKPLLMECPPTSIYNFKGITGFKMHYFPPHIAQRKIQPIKLKHNAFSYILISEVLKYGGGGTKKVYLNSTKYGILIIYWFLNEDKTLLESSSASARTVPFVEWGC